jgi:hypothetical protein
MQFDSTLAIDIIDLRTLITKRTTLSKGVLSMFLFIFVLGFTTHLLL